VEEPLNRLAKAVAASRIVQILKPLVIIEKILSGRLRTNNARYIPE